MPLLAEGVAGAAKMSTRESYTYAFIRLNMNYHNFDPTLLLQQLKIQAECPTYFTLLLIHHYEYALC